MNVLNLRRGLLRTWLVIMMPTVAYLGYSVYANHRCVAESENARAFWITELRRRTDDTEKWVDGVRQGIPDRQLRPFGAENPKAYVDEARENLTDAASGVYVCEADRRTALILLFSAPAASLTAVFALLWVRAGFSRQ